MSDLIFPRKIQSTRNFLFIPTLNKKAAASQILVVVGTYIFYNSLMQVCKETYFDDTFDMIDDNTNDIKTELKAKFNILG